MKKGTVYFKDGRTADINDVIVVDSSLIKFSTESNKYAYVHFTAFKIDCFYKMGGPDELGNLVFVPNFDIDHIEINNNTYFGLQDTGLMKILK